MSDVKIGQVYTYKGLTIKVLGTANNIDPPKVLVQVADLDDMKGLLPVSVFEKFKLDTSNKK